MSFLLEIIRLGLANLRRHMLRSVLTSLGIILGVAAVIVMVSIGEGNKQAALRDIQALGATNIIIRSQRPPEAMSFGTEERSFLARYGISRQDLERLTTQRISSRSRPSARRSHAARSACSARRSGRPRS